MLRPKLSSSKRKSRSANSTRPPARLQGEALERRDLLAVFVVTSPFDGVAGDLRSAINMSNATPGIVDEIQFTVPSVSLSLGEISITDAVNINFSVPASRVTINADPGSRIFNIDDGLPGQQTVNMNELTLRGGSALQGGAIFNRERLDIRNSTITGNTADSGGAAFNVDGVLRIDNVAVYGNSASYEGGGFMNLGGTLDVLNSVLSNNSVANNNGQPTYGGAIRNLFSATATLINSQVQGNAAYAYGGARAYGGGIAVQADSAVHLFDSDVGDNYATSEGGGLFVTDNSILNSSQQSNVFANTSGEAGGGIYLRNSLSNISDTTITGNITELRGGGLSAGVDVDLTMSNVDILDNTTNFFSADGSGGGLYLSGFGQANGPVVDISNSRISGNNVDPNGSPGGEFGGGISALYGTTLTLAGTDVENNKASISGGGIYASDYFSLYAPTVTIIASTISLNESGISGGGMAMVGGSLGIHSSSFADNVTDGRGGGLFLTGLGSPSPSALNVDIRDSVLSGNIADVEGGGIAAGPSMTLLIQNSVLEANRTFGRGAGLYATALGIGYLPNTTTILDSAIRNNVAEYDPAGPPNSYASGGGIWGGLAADIVVEATTISGNRADRYGGGMMVNEAPITLASSTVDGNVAGVRGGGAYVKNSDVVFDQNTWTANGANGDGGAISLSSFLNNNFVTITSNTISLNQSDRDQDGFGAGGGVFVNDNPLNNVQVDISDSIIADNFSDDPLSLPHNDDLYDGPGLAGFAPVAMKYSLVGSQLGTTRAAANPDADGNIVGTAFSPIDPLLAPLINNGGVTETMLPQLGSPAIERGDPAVLPSPGSFDQRGAPFDRVVHRMDMGSVELQSSFPGPDLNADGLVDAADINLLTQEIAIAGYVGSFDMNVDGILDLADIDRWLCKAGHTNLGPNLSYRVGDANLDGFVDGIDFVTWNANKFSPSSDWTSGDFDADGAVDGSDFVRWNANKFLAPFVCNPVPITDPSGPDVPDVPNVPNGPMLTEPSVEISRPTNPREEQIDRPQAMTPPVPIAAGTGRLTARDDRRPAHGHEIRDRSSTIAILDLIWAEETIEPSSSVLLALS